MMLWAWAWLAVVVGTALRLAAWGEGIDTRNQKRGWRWSGAFGHVVA